MTCRHHPGHLNTCIGAALVASSIIAGCARAPSTAQPAPSTICYRLTASDWRVRDTPGKQIPHGLQPRTDWGEIALLPGPMAGLAGPSWYTGPLDTLRIGTGTVMVSWDIVARRTDRGFVGRLTYFDDFIIDPLAADVTGEMIPCRGPPGPLGFHNGVGTRERIPPPARPPGRMAPGTAWAHPLADRPPGSLRWAFTTT